MGKAPQYVRLDGQAITIIFALVEGGRADVVYLGAVLPQGEDLAAIAHCAARGGHENQPDTPPVPGILPQAGHGKLRGNVFGADGQNHHGNTECP